MRARVTLRGLVPLGDDGSDVVGIGVVPWAELEPIDEPSAPMRVRFVWMDERGRVVRRRELGGRGVFEIVTPAARGKGRKGTWAKRRVLPRLVWMRAVKRAARDGSLVVARDQRGAWWLEVSLWGVAIALGVAAAVWWFQAQVAPLLGSSDAASAGLVAIMGFVCLCWPGIVLMLMWPRRDVLRGRVARWSRIDASGIRAGWSQERAEHFRWSEIKDVQRSRTRHRELVTDAGREVMLSLDWRGVCWVDEKILAPKFAAMEARAREAMEDRESTLIAELDEVDHELHDRDATQERLDGGPRWRSRQASSWWMWRRRWGSIQRTRPLRWPRSGEDSREVGDGERGSGASLSAW